MASPSSRRHRPKAPGQRPRWQVQPYLQRLAERRADVMQALQLQREAWSRAREWDQRLGATESALAEAQARYGEFYDFVPTPFLVLDGRLRVIQINEAGRALLARGRLLRTPFVSFVSEEDAPALVAAASKLGPGDVHSQELRVRSPRGLITVQALVKVSEHAPAGRARPGGERVHTYYLALLDLSEIRRLEQERQRSAEAEAAARAAARAKDEFIAMLSHELRTPLAPILSAAEALAAARLRGQLGEAAAMIRRNVLIEARLIDDLLDAARVTQKRLHVERRPLSLHRLIRDVTADWVPEYARDGLELRLELRARRDTVDADPDRIAQVLRNVLVNAAKFTPAGGLVTVRTEEADGFVRASVTDSGQGLTVDELEHLFEPFQLGRETRVGRAGLGLGLAICRGIVEAHGGRIRARSPGLGRGTTIEIELERSDQPTTVAPVVPTRPIAAMRPAVARRTARRPRAQPLLTEPDSETATPARRSYSTEWTPGHANRILLVEDHEDSAETLAIILSMKGYRVSVARSLAEATQLAETPDILISDISLPDGSGLELPRLLQREPPLKAIAMSGYGTEVDRRRSQEAGFAEHLTKPVNIDQLLAALRRLTPAPPLP